MSVTARFNHKTDIIFLSVTVCFLHVFSIIFLSVTGQSFNLICSFSLYIPYTIGSKRRFVWFFWYSLLFFIGWYALHHYSFSIRLKYNTKNFIWFLFYYWFIDYKILLYTFYRLLTVLGPPSFFLPLYTATQAIVSTPCTYLAIMTLVILYTCFRT